MKNEVTPIVLIVLIKYRQYTSSKQNFCPMCRNTMSNARGILIKSRLPYPPPRDSHQICKFHFSSILSLTVPFITRVTWLSSLPSPSLTFSLIFREGNARKTWEAGNKSPAPGRGAVDGDPGFGNVGEKIGDAGASASGHDDGCHIFTPSTEKYITICTYFCCA